MKVAGIQTLSQVFSNFRNSNEIAMATVTKGYALLFVRAVSTAAIISTKIIFLESLPAIAQRQVTLKILLNSLFMKLLVRFWNPKAGPRLKQEMMMKHRFVLTCSIDRRGDHRTFIHSSRRDRRQTFRHTLPPALSTAAFENFLNKKLHKPKKSRKFFEKKKQLFQSFGFIVQPGRTISLLV